MLDECQDRRNCQVLVNSRVFGADQCPGSSKHLIVWYKCRPSKSLIASDPDSDTFLSPQRNCRSFSWCLLVFLPKSVSKNSVLLLPSSLSSFYWLPLSLSFCLLPFVGQDAKVSLQRGLIPPRYWPSLTDQRCAEPGHAEPRSTALHAGMTRNGHFSTLQPAVFLFGCDSFCAERKSTRSAREVHRAGVSACEERGGWR